MIFAPGGAVDRRLPSLKFRPTEWTIRTDHAMHRFGSLSQMGRWLTANPLEVGTEYTVQRNGRTIERGVWQEDLHNTATL